jgi:predicted peptidase
MNKNPNLLVSVVCAAALWAGAAVASDWTAEQVATTRMAAKTFTSTGKNPIKVEYLLYLPKGYLTNAAARWPLMIYLHGAAERTDNVFGVTWHGPPQLVRRGADFPFIIVAPLCPPKQSWGNTKLLHLLDNVEQEYRVDTNRVYLTGMSLGGSGTWSLGLTHAKSFAAIAPICGYVKPDILKKLTPEQTEAVKSLSVWAFHGAKDTTVPPMASQRMVEALKAMGVTNVLFAKYPTADHDSWTVTYQNQDFYKWLLKQQRKP